MELVRIVDERVAEEREECAKVAEEYLSKLAFYSDSTPRNTASAIRARGKE